jgi:uncharacterized protein (UPF0332 family)
MSATPEEMLSCAQALCADANCETKYRASISRSYYAAFHAARNFHNGLATPGSVGNSNGGVHAQLIAQLSNPGISKSNRKFFLSQAIAKSLRPIVDARVDADYHLDIDIEKSFADDIYTQASEVVARAT